MYYNYVINNARRTVTIREYDDFGNRVATYRTYPFSLVVWNDVRDDLIDSNDNQELLAILAHGKSSRKVR